MVVPSAMLPEVMDWSLLAQRTAYDLEEIDTRLRTVMSYATIARTMLVEAASLLDEDIDAVEIISNSMFAKIPAGDDLLDQTSVDAITKLAVCLLSGAPLLPGAIRSARDLVASVFSLSPPITGPLQEALIDLKIAIDSHDIARMIFFLCTPKLTVQPDVWSAWREYNDFTIRQQIRAKLWLEDAIEEAKEAESVHHLCLITSPQRGVHMVKAKMILHNTIEDLDETLEALRNMRDGIKLEELIMRQAINEALAP